MEVTKLLWLTKMLGRGSIVIYLIPIYFFIKTNILTLDQLIFSVILLGIFELNKNAEIDLLHTTSWLEVISFFHICCLMFLMLLKPQEQILIIACVFANDAAAYFIGKYATIFSSKKIFPKTSKNKTWRGFIAGILTGSILGFILTSEMPVLYRFFGLFISLAATFGDWLGSKYKRSKNLKDSGQNWWTKDWMFGHGGIYDRFGALAMAVPILLLLKLALF